MSGISILEDRHHFESHATEWRRVNDVKPRRPSRDELPAFPSVGPSHSSEEIEIILATRRQVESFVLANKKLKRDVVPCIISIGASMQHTPPVSHEDSSLVQLLISPGFSFGIAAVASVVSGGLFVTGRFMPLISFGVGAISFALLGTGIVMIERAMKHGLPE